VSIHESEPSSLGTGSRELAEGVAASRARCSASSDNCEKPVNVREHCRVCAEACRRCERACNAVLSDLG